MKTQVNKPETLSLYDRATAQLKEQKSEEYTVFSEIETQKIIHELQVHKIELEMQNEELKIAKEEAEKATQKYTDLYNFAPSGYMTLSKKGSIVELNFSAAMMLGNEVKYLTNKNFIDFLSPETRTLFSLFLNTLFIEKAKETCEVVLMVKNSLPVYAHVDGIVLENNEQCYLTITDTTKEKVAENTIKESQRLRIIGEMASGIAHDFNNSLQVMLSSLNIVRLKSEFDKPTLKSLENIELMILEVSERVRTLQKFGEKKQHEINHSILNLQTLIEDCINQISPLLKDTSERNGVSIKINTRLIPQTFISGNKFEINSVLLNTIKNCIEALPNGGVIDLVTEIKSDKIFLTITDSGIGMSDEIKSKIFQPFFTTKGFELGRGLGMSSAFSIIKEHSGIIYIKNSELGKGTTIEIILPLKKKL